MKTPFGKTVKIETPYAVYRDEASGFEYRVLKTYQTPEKEGKNPYARWFLATKSPFTGGSYEFGDGYVSEVLNCATLVECTSEWKRYYGDF